MKFGVVVNQNMKGTISRQILDRTPPQQGTLILTLFYYSFNYIFPIKTTLLPFTGKKYFKLVTLNVQGTDECFSNH